MKASIITASLSLTGFASASLGNAHGSFHMRRGGYANNDVCTVYTTVYETACKFYSFYTYTRGHTKRKYQIRLRKIAREKKNFNRQLLYMSRIFS